MHRFLVGEVLEAQCCQFGPSAPAGGESDQQQGAIAQVHQAFAGAGQQQLRQNVGCDRLFALALPRPGAGANRKP